jgi:hypothetical protein
MASLAARRHARDEPGQGEGAEASALQAVAHAADRVGLLAGAGSPVLLARALMQLTDATVAVERLGRRRAKVVALLEEGYDARDGEEGVPAEQDRPGLRLV